MHDMIIFREPQTEFDRRADPVQQGEYWGAWGAQIGAMRAAGVKEQMGGYFVVEVPDLAAAIDWAGRSRCGRCCLPIRCFDRA